VRPLGLVFALTSLGAAFPDSPAEAKQVAGVGVGMDEKTAEENLSRLGSIIRREGPGSSAFTLTTNDVEAQVCGSEVVWVSRKMRGDFHAFGKLVQLAREQQGEPRQSFYSVDGEQGSATSLGFVWHKADEPIYSLHFSLFGDVYEISEILDPATENLEQVVQNCGLSDL
jgi:hypothetical protein